MGGETQQRKSKGLRETLKVRYKNDLQEFVLKFENWNVKAKVNGIGFRKLIRDQIPDESVRRMSKHQEYADDRDWIEALRQGVCDEEDFQEGKRLRDNNFSGLNSSGNRKHEEPTTAKTTKKPKYTAREKRVYQPKKNEENVDKGNAGPLAENDASSLGRHTQRYRLESS